MPLIILPTNIFTIIQIYLQFFFIYISESEFILLFLIFLALSGLYAYNFFFNFSDFESASKGRRIFQVHDGWDYEFLTINISPSPCQLHMLTKVHLNPVQHLGRFGPQLVAKHMVQGFGEESLNWQFAVDVAGLICLTEVYVVPNWSLSPVYLC